MTERRHAEVFWFGQRRFDPASGRVTLEYGFDQSWTFVEELDLPLSRPALPAQALERALELLHFVCGISYFKAICPAQIETRGPPPSAELALLLDTLYLNGLAEFAHVNRLDLHGKINFPAGEAGIPAQSAALDRAAIVALGGGKDSLVSIETLRRADLPVTVFWVGDSELIEGVAQRTGFPQLKISRRIDTRLFELNRLGALNGHIPVTAINSSIGVLCALLIGADQVVFSNERSADVGNFSDSHGLEVNHQYSKSFAFEALFANYVERFVASDLRYFSLLRPLLELAVTERFARLEQYFAVFSSCNRNFRILSPKPAMRWCGACPKCHFVFLALAPHLPKPKLVAIFGRNLLDDARLIQPFEALMEFNALKPFECVGEGIEARAAFAAIGARADWREDAVVEHFNRVVRPSLEAQDLSLAPLLLPRGAHRVPPELLALL